MTDAIQLHTEIRDNALFINRVTPDGSIDGVVLQLHLLTDENVSPEQREARARRVWLETNWFNGMAEDAARRGETIVIDE